MKKNNKETIFEILAEGGSITAYRSFVGYNKMKNAEYILFYETSEMDIDVNGEEYGTGNRSKLEIIDFDTFWKKTVKKYPTIYELHLNFMHKDYKLNVALDLRKRFLKNKIQINDLYSKQSWLENLDVKEYELIDKSPFYNKEFIELLSRYSNRSLNIMEENGWNRIDIMHSKFETIEQYKKYLSENNERNFDGFFNNLANSGVYTYFDGENCLYVGKAKKISNRLIDHFKSSKGIVKKNNPNDGKRQREMFGFYKNKQITIFYMEVDDKYKSGTGELLRKTFEGMLQLEYKPEFDEKIDYTQQFV